MRIPRRLLGLTLVLNDADLARQDVVLLLDARPDEPQQRAAFRKYLEDGGAFLGFHFAAFALTPSRYPQESGTNRSLSSTFASRDQNRLLAQALVWMGTGRPPRRRAQEQAP